MSQPQGQVLEARNQNHLLQGLGPVSGRHDALALFFNALKSARLGIFYKFQLCANTSTHLTWETS